MNGPPCRSGRPCRPERRRTLAARRALCYERGMTAAAARSAAPTDPADFSGLDLLALYARRALSPVEVMRAVIARIEACEPQLKALYAFDPDGALAAARASEARWMKGEARALDGMPATIKENIATKGVPVPLGTAARPLDPAADGRAAGGAAARGRRDHPRQDDDAGLRHALLGPVELPPARPATPGTSPRIPAAARPGRARRRRPATGRSMSAPISAARSACRPAGAAFSA